MIKSNIINFDSSIVKKLTGLEINSIEIWNILLKIGCEISPNDNKIVKQITIPSWRHDLTIAEDLVAEIIRLYGLDNLTLEPLPTQNCLNMPKNDIEHKKVFSDEGCDRGCYSEMMDLKNWNKFKEQNGDT